MRNGYHFESKNFLLRTKSNEPDMGDNDGEAHFEEGMQQ